MYIYTHIHIYINIHIYIITYKCARMRAEINGTRVSLALEPCVATDNIYIYIKREREREIGRWIVVVLRHFIELLIFFVNLC